MKNIAIFTLALLAIIIFYEIKNEEVISDIYEEEDYGDMIGEETLKQL